MSGQNQMRAALLRRRDKLLTIAESTEIGVQALAAYSRSAVALSPPSLMKLTKALFGPSASYDARSDAIFLTGGPPPLAS